MWLMAVHQLILVLEWRKIFVMTTVKISLAWPDRFFLLYSDGKKGYGELRIVFLFYRSPDFGDYVSKSLNGFHDVWRLRLYDVWRVLAGVLINR